MKKQERFSKEFEKLCKRKLTLNVDIESGYVFDSISSLLDNTNVVLFIQSLEQNYEDWSVTEELFQYFAKTMLTYDENINGEYPDPLSDETKKSIERLYHKFCAK